jgi:phytoene desaturase
MVAQIPSLLTLKSYLSVAQLVNMHVKHPQIRQAFSIHPLLVGGNPFDTTSIYALIHYLEREWGVFFCMGGTGTLIKELEALMIRQGISIRCNTDIEQILVEKGRTSGVRTTSGEIISSDRVICNADTPAVYDELLSAQPKRRKKAIPDKLTRYSMGLYVLFFGTRKKYDSIAHHTIWMGKRYRALLADIFSSKILADDFSLYLHRPTATDPTFAPDGCDSFYVLCPVPNLQGNVNWDVQGPALQERIITALNRTIMPELKETITDAFWMSPREFKSNYRAKHGAGFSIAPIFAQSAWFRYHNQDPHIDNLFFTGAGTHPGAGMPGVLSSAKVVENLITNMPEEQAP